MNTSNFTHPVTPHLALLLVQFLFATMFVVGKLAVRTVPPLALVGFRMIGAAILLVALARLSGKLRPIEKVDWRLLVFSSALGLVLNQWLFVKGLSLTTAINSSLISTTIPAATLLIGIFLKTDRPTWRRTLGIALAGAGVLYLIGPGRADFSSANRAGDLILVISALCYGAYLALSKDLVRRYDALNVIAWMFIIATIVAAPAGLISLMQVPLNSIPWIVWLEIAYIIAFPSAAAYFLNAWALARVPPSTVAVYIYLQPLIAFALAPLVLGEAVGVRVIISTVLVFAGVFLVTRQRPSETNDAVLEGR